MFFSSKLGSPVHSRAQINFFAARIQCLTSRKAKTGGNLPQRSTFGASDRGTRVLSFTPETKEAADVDLAVRLNVLAVCAVFLFVGAVLLGAF